LYLVDCNVTGSSRGTPDDPEFVLKDLFEHHVFPKLDQLVAPGGSMKVTHPSSRATMRARAPKPSILGGQCRSVSDADGTGNHKRRICRTA
jgi:hypothetical protein